MKTETDWRFEVYRNDPHGPAVFCGYKETLDQAKELARERFGNRVYRGMDVWVEQAREVFRLNSKKKREG